MKREFLTELGLEKSVVDDVMAEHGKTVTESKTKLTEATAEVTGLKASLSKRDADIEELKKTAGESEALKTQITSLQAQYEADKTEAESLLAKTRLDSAVDLALTTAKAKNITAVRALIDGDILKITDGKVVGLNEQLTTIQKDNPYLFEIENEEKPPATPNIVIGGNPNGGNQSSDVPDWKTKLNTKFAEVKNAT